MKLSMQRAMAALAMPVALAFGLPGSAWAAPVQLLTNGNFEAGSFTGWTTNDLAGGSGNWAVDAPGTTTPTSGMTTSAAGGGAHGNFYAVTDQTGGGTHALSQSFTVAAGASSVIFAFDMFVNNYGGGTFCGPGLNHTGAAAQCARVDLLTAAATAFDTGAGVLQNFFLGSDAGTNPNPFTHYSFDITSLVAAGGTFKIRFAESDNQFFFNQGVDNVSITADTAVPEPTSLALVGIAMCGLVASARRRKA